MILGRRSSKRERPQPATSRDLRETGKDLVALVEDTRRRRIAAEAAGQVRGRHFTEWIPLLDQMRKEKRDDDALALLLECIGATERAAAIEGLDPAPGYTERAAIIYHRRRNYDAEIAIIAAVSPSMIAISAS